jgi:uncharacterized protein
MPSRPFRVGRSSTGLGLFAIERIEKKTVVVIYRGRRIPTPLAHERERRYGAKYMFEINRRWTIDGSSRRNLARYINHSCAANTESVLRKGKMEFVALRRIAPGEEITLDYGPDYFDLFIKETGCRCAACKAKTKTAARQPRRKR